MKTVINFVKGVAVGIAMLVPGVSGGTMAIILGIYDGIIHAIGSYFKDWKKHTIFLLEVGAGGLVGLLAFSHLLESAIRAFPFAMQYLFMGVIVGGIPVLYKRSKSAGGRSWTDYLFFAAGAILVFFLSSEPETTTALVTASGIKGVVALFFAGVIMAVALVLPGISASFVLLTLGLYGLVLGAINTVNIPFLVPLGLGVVTGTLASTKAIEVLLDKFPSKAYSLILGFVVGSIVPVYPGIPAGMELFASIGLFIVGGAAIFAIGRAGFAD
jgi:putative membrane protein